MEFSEKHFEVGILHVILKRFDPVKKILWFQVLFIAARMIAVKLLQIRTYSSLDNKFCSPTDCRLADDFLSAIVKYLISVSISFKIRGKNCY